VQDREAVDLLDDVADVDRCCRRPALDDGAAKSPRSSGVISVRSLVRHLGSSSRSKIDRRIARVLSAIGAAVSHFSPN
jgi:hypothetical protein